MISVDFWRNQLGRRMVALMIFVSALLSVGAAAIQLYIAFVQDRNRALGEFTVIEDSFRIGLERALWEFNFDQVEVMLDGIYAQTDIAYLDLTTPTGQTWTRGTLSDGLMVSEFPMLHRGRDDDAVPVGTLTAGLSLASVRTRLWNQFVTLVLSNFVKTFLASLAMLAIFDRLAARHFRAIAQQTGMNWLERDAQIHLDRAQPRTPDELDKIVSSLNEGWQNVRDAHTELYDVNTKLADANDEQAEFTYAISHDMKAPINTIQMLHTELQDLAGNNLGTKGDEVLKDMQSTITRMGRLVDDILAYSRTVGNDMNVETVDLNEEVATILDVLKGDIAKSNANFTVKDLPVIRGNQLQLRLLLQNLISNAIKFRKPDRAPVIEIKSVAEPDPKFVRFLVSDNGIGISPSHHSEIFGLFKRLHAHDVYEGSGIGLTICQRIVSNHNGQMSITSQEGIGTSFEVTLPVLSYDG